MKRIVLLLSISVLATLILGWVNLVEAQQAGKVPRIGFVKSVGSPEKHSRRYRAFLQGLRDLGYIEGQNILIEWRSGRGRLDRMSSLVNDLVQQKVDVLVVTNQVAIRAAKKATQTIPIVMRSSVDPVAAGHVASLAHPGGNITGLTYRKRDLCAKRMELLKEVLPTMSRLAILWDTDGPGPTAAFKVCKVTARGLKLDLQSLEVRGPNPDFEVVFQAAKKERREALLIIANPLIRQHQKRIMELVTRNRLPSMNPIRRFVSAGGLMYYGVDRAALLRRAATYVDKILKGANPGDLPIERPTKFELIVNLKTARNLGITIPPEILLQATKVIK